jgi:hypothetical protein
MVFVSLGFSFYAAYFHEARLDGAVRYVACTCGFKRAKVANGEVVLIEPNHATPAGAAVATIEIEHGVCRLRRIRADGTLGTAESYEIDHLGAKYYDERCGGFVYVIMADNWKWYPFIFFTRIERLFR